MDVKNNMNSKWNEQHTMQTTSFFTFVYVTKHWRSQICFVSSCKCLSIINWILWSFCVSELLIIAVWRILVHSFVDDEVGSLEFCLIVCLCFYTTCAGFVQSVARLKEDVLRTGLRTGSSPDVSTLLLPQERTNTASQTDLSGEVSISAFYLKEVEL